jgi:hypothetical protein
MPMTAQKTINCTTRGLVNAWNWAHRVMSETGLARVWAIERRF